MNNSPDSTPTKDKTDPLVEELFNLTRKPGQQASSTQATAKDDLTLDQLMGLEPVDRPETKKKTQAKAGDPDEPFLTNLGQGFESGGRQFVSGIATVGGEIAGIFDDESGESLKKWAREYTEAGPAHDESWGQFIGSLIPSTLPTAAAIAAAPFTGGSSLVPLAALGTLGVSAAGGGMMEYDAYMERKGREGNDLSRIAVGTAYGAAEYLGERFALGKLLPDGLGAKILRGSVPDAEKAGKHLIAEYAKRQPKKAAALLKSVGKGAVAEGPQESVTELAQQATAMLYEDNEDIKKRMDELPDNVWKAFLGGSIMGAGLGPLSFASQSKVHRDRRKQNGGVMLARNKQTGEPLELIGPKGQTEEGEPIFAALDYDGEQVSIKASDIDQAQELSLQQFDMLLQDRLDLTQFEVSQREPVQVATYNGDDVQIVGEDGEGGYFIQMPDGTQKQVLSEELDDMMEIDPLTQVDAERQQQGQPTATEQMAQAEALRNTENEQDPALPLYHPETGDMVFPGTPEHQQALELIEQEQAERLEQEIEEEYTQPQQTEDQTDEEQREVISEEQQSAQPQPETEQQLREGNDTGGPQVDTESQPVAGEESEPRENQLQQEEELLEQEVESQPQITDDNFEQLATEFSEQMASDEDKYGYLPDDLRDKYARARTHLSQQLQKINTEGVPDYRKQAVRDYWNLIQEYNTKLGLLSRIAKRERAKAKEYKRYTDDPDAYESGTRKNIEELESRLDKILGFELDEEQAAQINEQMDAERERAAQRREEVQRNKEEFEQRDSADSKLLDRIIESVGDQTYGWDLEQVGREFLTPFRKGKMPMGKIPEALQTARILQDVAGDALEDSQLDLIRAGIVMTDKGHDGTFDAVVRTLQQNNDMFEAALIPQLKEAFQDAGLMDRNIFEEGQPADTEEGPPQVGGYNPDFEQAPKVTGDTETFTLPNGEQHEVQYAVVEAEDILPSHNPINFTQNEGFPTLADGTTPNDNDYENSQDARDRVVDIAQNMDERIFQDTPIISEEGIVVSGNNRTMSTQRNIRQENPRAEWYRQEVRKRAQRYGIEPSQIEGIENPMLVRIDRDVTDYSTDTFKAYNISVKKQKNDVEKAVVVSKSITDRTVDALVDALKPDQFGTIRAALDSPPVARQAIRILEDAGIITQNEKAIYYDSKNQAVTARGRDLVELVAKGAILNSEALRNSDVAGVKAFANKITFALPALLEVKALGPEFDLSGVVSDAVNLQRQIVEQGLTARDIYAQQSLFGEDAVPPSVKFIHYLIDSGRDRFKDAVSIYARSARSGGQDMFNTEPRTRPEIFNDLFDYAQRQANEQQRAIIQGIRPAQSDNERGGQDQGFEQGQARQPESDTESRPEPDQQLEQQPEESAEQPPTQRPEWGETNTRFTKDDADRARQILRDKLNNINAGLDPEMLSAGIQLAGFHIEAGARRFGQFAKAMVNELGDGIKPYLKSFYNGVRDYPGFDSEGMDPYETVAAADVDAAIAEAQEIDAEIDDTTLTEQETEADDGRSTTDNLEPDSPRTGAENRVGQEDVQPGREPDRPGAEQDVRPADQQAPAPGSERADDRATDVSGEQSDPGLFESAQRPGPDAGTAESSRQEIRSRIRGERAQAERSGEEATGRAAENLPTRTNDLSFERKLKLQRQADNLPVRFNNEENIRRSLPVLFDQQKGDVVKAERRFFGDNPGKGMMFTNGTGTGKTYTGLGIIKRFFNAGKQDILIVVPSDRKVQDWIEDGQNLGLIVNQLEDIQDAGQGVSITTYANFQQNEAVAEREFDLVVYDESHKIMSNQEGEITSTAQAHFHTANVASYAKDRAARNIVGPQPEFSKDMSEQAREQAQKELSEWRKEAEQRKDEIEAEIERLVNKTKVVFLSATPFSYHKNLKYADGILFNIEEGKEHRHTGYNEGDNYDQFFVQNFGYRIRYNKLTQPDADVNVGLMERRFHEKMKEEGVASNRRLDLDQDYSRDFVLADSELGKTIDRGIKTIQDTEELRPLRDVLRKKMNWIRTSQLLESIKAREMVPRTREHLDLGRKVVIFHNYKTQRPEHPFHFEEAGPPAPELNYRDPTAEAYNQAVQIWNEQYSEFTELDLSGLSNPVEVFTEAFGSDKVGVFNGDIPNRLRSDYIERFNADNFEQPVLVVQVDAGKEGISLHDTTGNYPRAMINLGLPIKPTDAIQMEGRIYRIGQQSNAIFEYPVLKTNFEMRAYASKVSERVRTPENLALGEDARNLELAFKQGYEEPLFDSPSQEQGTGGKEADYSFDEMSEFEKAKTWFFGRQKKTQRNKSREGTDYFATPEPLGLKMVEWLRPRPNMDILEPSAGHGAIARYLPSDTHNKMLEPSYELFSELSLNGNGEAIQTKFEDHHIVNKYDGIVMNPPYGTGGKTAMEHLAKAAKHLRNGGRVIAIIPEGPAMDKRLDKWFQSEEADNMYLAGEVNLPAVTFSRAATQVRTRMVVIDKFTGEDTSRLPSATVRDLSGIETFEELFDRIELMEMPPRVELTEEEAPKRVPQKDADSMFEIVAGEHTRDKYPIWTVTMSEFLDRNRFMALKKVANINNGYYSSYNKGEAVRGFVFKEESDAQQFTEHADRVLQEDIPQDMVEKYIENLDDDVRFQRLEGTSGRQFEREQLQQQLEEAQKELQAAQRALDSKQRELNRRLQEDQENLFGERQTEGNNALFDMRADPSQVQKALKPFTDRFEVARRQVNRLAKKLEQLPERPDPTLFDQPGLNLQRVDTQAAPDVYPAENITPISQRSRQIRRELEEITQGWAQRDKIVIAEHPDLLPQAIKERLAKEDGRIGGLFTGGKAYVLTYNLKDSDEGIQALAHEAIGHLGIRGLLEFNSKNRQDYLDRYAQLTDDIYQSFKDDPQFKQLVDRYGFDLRRTNHRQQAAEEFIARIAESKSAPSIMDRVINFINDLLRNLGMQTKLTRADVARMLADARRYVEGSTETTYMGAAIMPVFKKDPIAPQFYSRLHNTISEKLDNRGTPESYAKTLRAWDKKGEFKSEELEWSGLLEWLEDQQGSQQRIHKDQVLEFLEENQVEVREIIKSSTTVEERADAWEDLRSFLANYDIDVRADMDNTVNFYDLNDNAVDRDYNEVLSIVVDQGGAQEGKQFERLADRYRKLSQKIGSTKFDQYTLPGGRGYKELLITLPWRIDNPRQIEPTDRLDVIERPNNPPEQRYAAMDQQSRIAGYGATREEAFDAGRAEQLRVGDQVRNTFRSSHFDELNILAHVRFNERTDSQGRRVLFLEEIQSDWHQKGRDQGYKASLGQGMPEGWSVKEVAPLDMTIERKGSGRWAMFDEEGNIASYTTIAESKDEAIPMLLEKAEKYNAARVPDAPFKSTWHELAIKKMIRYAAENDFDMIGWTPGEVQAERYDLSEKIDYIEKGVSAINPNHLYIDIIVPEAQVPNIGLTVHGETYEVINQEGDYGDLEGKQLDEVLGKELAQKVIDMPYNERLQGDDLSMGGEGMKTFYNKIVPNFVSSYVKKWDSEIEVAETYASDYEYLDNFEYRGPEITAQEIANFDNPSNDLSWDDFEARERRFLREIQSKMLGGQNFSDAFMLAIDDIMGSYNPSGAAGVTQQTYINAAKELADKLGGEFGEKQTQEYISQDDAYMAFHDGEDVYAEYVDQYGNNVNRLVDGESILDIAIEQDPNARFYIYRADRTKGNVKFLAAPVTNKMFKSVLEEGQPLFKRFEPVEETTHQYEKRFDGFLRKYQDLLVDGKRIIEGVRQEGGNINDRTNFYDDYTRSMGRAENQVRRFRLDQVDPLIDYMNNLYRNHDLTYEEIRQYLIAKHAPERNALMRQKNPDAPQLTEIDGRPIEDIMEDFRQRGKIEALEGMRKHIEAINEFTIQTRVDGGLMSQERADELREQYDYYVPFRGFVEHMNIDPTVMSGDIAAKGRSSEPGDVMAYLLAMGETAIISAEKNKVKRVLLEFARQNYERSDIMRIKNVYYRKTGEVDEETGIEKWEPTLAKPTSEELINGTVKRQLDPEKEQVFWNTTTSPLTDNSVRVMVDGRPFVIEFTRPHIAAAINGMAVDKLPKALEGVNRYTRILKGLITQYSPEFGLRNLMRDSTTGFINLSIDFDTPTAAKIVNPVTLGKGLKALRKAIRTDTWEGEWGEAAQRFVEDGSMTGYWQLDTVRDRTRQLQEQIEKGSFTESPWTHTKDRLKTIADFVDDYNRVIENVFRLSTYKYLTENEVINLKTGKPYTRKQAALYAKDLTVNFNRRGNESTMVGSLFIFFNAAVQGIARQAMPFFSTDTRTRWRAAATPVIVGATAYAMIEAMRYGLGKDDDDEYYYDKVNEYTRTHNILLPNLLSEDPEDYLRIPLPYGYNVYWAAGDVLNRFIHGATDAEEAALEMAVTTIDAYNPIGSATGKTAFDSAVKTFTPTVLQPGFEIVTNTDFAGNPIKPEPFPFAVEEPQSQQYFRYVSDWAKKTAEYLNRVSGGDEVTSGFIDVSPEHIEYVTNYFGGGVAKFFSNIWNSGEHVYDAYQGNEEMELTDLYDVPFARNFYGKVSRSATRDDFIEHERTIRRLVNEHTEYIERGNIPKARQHLIRNQDIIALEPELKSIKRQMRSLRAYQKQLSGIDTKEARDAMDKINESIHELYLAFNKRFNQVKEQADKQPRRASELIQEE